MPIPRFSVVIPTRNRAETLPFAVRTCLAQNRDDVEILVADNCSRPSAQETLAAPEFKAVRVLPAERPLAMTENWERAVAAAQGEWIVVLGDDDGLLPDALNHAEELAKRYSSRAVRWNAAYYTWPNFPYEEQANYLRVPLGRTSRVVPFAEVVAGVLDFRACYTQLPMLYNSAVRRDVLDELMRRSGRVFGSRSPDVYSGFAVGHVVKSFVTCDYPLSIAGSSGKSNGVANCFIGDSSTIKNDFDQLNGQAKLLCHPQCPEPPVWPFAPVMDSYLFARDALFADAPYPYDRRKFLGLCASQYRAATTSEWRRGLDQILFAARDEPELSRWLAEHIATISWMPPSRPQLRSETLGYDGTALHLDVSSWEVRDVDHAARLCQRLLGSPPTRGPVNAIPDKKGASPRQASGTGVPPEGPMSLELASRRISELETQLQDALRQGALRNIPRRMLNKLTGKLRGL